LISTTARNIKEVALYAQDTLAIRQFTINLGVRGDVYRGLSQANQVEPRVGISYLIKPTTTVLRASTGGSWRPPIMKT